MSSEKKFTGVFVDAGLLATKKLSPTEKIIMADVHYFQKEGKDYYFTNESLGKKFGVGKRTVSGAISRLIPFGFIADVGPGKTGGRYTRYLRITDKGYTLFGNHKGAESATSKSKQGAGIATSKKKKAQNLLLSRAESATSTPKEVAKSATEITTTKITTKITAQVSDETRLAELLLSEILSRKPDFHYTKTTLKNWTKVIEQMIRIQHRSAARIEAVILWATADSFWYPHILSASALRKKFETLEEQMRKGKSNGRTTKQSTQDPMQYCR